MVATTGGNADVYLHVPPKLAAYRNGLVLNDTGRSCGGSHLIPSIL